MGGLYSNFLWDDMTPNQYAQKLQRDLGINNYPIDLIDVCRSLGIVLKEKDLGRGIDGCLVTSSSGKKGILVNEKTSYQARKNFTIAHELGHFIIKRHSASEYWCFSTDIEDYRSKNHVEKEANEFASEFLLPAKEITPFLKRDRVYLETVMEVAEKFGVSLTACAIKMVSLVRYCNCVVVMSEKGKIKWTIPSINFRRRYQIKTKKLSEDSFAADLFSGRSVPSSPQKVGPAVWLASRGINDLAYVEEESFLLPRLEMVLSIVTVPENDPNELNWEEDSYLEV